MSGYHQKTILHDPIGNNALSYAERIARLGSAKITIPSLLQISSLDQIQIGPDIVIEDIDERGVLHSCTGLMHIYQRETQRTPIYIMDNHHHALYFWTRYIKSFRHKSDIPHSPNNTLSHPITLLHIDQHSDLNMPPHIPSYTQYAGYTTKQMWEYTNHICQISSFMQPFLARYPDTHFEWIKSEYQLLHKTSSDIFRNSLQTSTNVLDIDLDFRAPQMSIANYHKTITLTRHLISQADLVTIATSPLFIDQSYALEVLHDLLS